MDLHEHVLNERARSLKRLGIKHFFAEPASSPPSLPESGDAQSARPKTVSMPPSEPELPPVLRSLFHGKHFPLHSLWVYDGMYQDMLLADPPQRLSVFKNIMQAAIDHLGWSNAAMTAWPLDQACGSLDQALERFNPKFVLVFETRPSHPGRPHSCARLMTDHPDTIRFPSLDAMAAGDRDSKNQAWKILQTIPAR